MMINLFLILGFSGLLLVCLAFYFKSKAMLLGIIGGLLLLILSIISFSSPLEMVVGSTSTTVGTTVTTIINTTLLDSNLSQIFSWGVLMIGFASLIGSSISIYANRFDGQDFDIEPGSATESKW